MTGRIVGGLATLALLWLVYSAHAAGQPLAALGLLVLIAADLGWRGAATGPPCWPAWRCGVYTWA